MEGNVMNTTTNIAQTILDQLGGSKFTAMTGAKNFLTIANGLQFKLPQNFAKNNISVVRITLLPSDTYSMEFGKILKQKDPQYGVKMPVYKKISVHEQVYADQLRSLFKDETGLDVSLGTMGKKNPGSLSL
tara:strand:+ start:1643 stop:2035 length:393 start_codon:yes stop_codon:yes gene_type:complete